MKILPEEVLDFFRKEGSKGGKIGGKRSLETMTAKQRSARAKKAVEAREASRTTGVKKKTVAKRANRPSMRSGKQQSPRSES